MEASKFTEVGYVGRDVESIIRDLMDISVSMIQREREEEVAVKAEEMANEIIANGPIAVQLVKDAVYIGTELPLEAAIEYGHKNVITSIATEDAKEGLTAFIEKRSPRWQGK